MELSRRRLITGFGLLVAAPVVVRASSIMPVRPITEDAIYWGREGFKRVRYVPGFEQAAKYAVSDDGVNWRPVSGILVYPSDLPFSSCAEAALRSTAFRREANMVIDWENLRRSLVTESA